MEKCIKCEINEIKHRNKQLCNECYKELRKQQKKNYSLNNVEKIKEINALYRENNKEKISQINKDWYKIPENKERKKLANKNRYI